MNNIDFDKQLSELNNILSREFDLKTFKSIEQKLEKNKIVIERIRKIKELQKKIVFFESTEKYDLVTSLDEEIKEIYSELEKIPIYIQYIQRKEFLEKELINISNYMEEKINKKIEQDKEDR